MRRKLWKRMASVVLMVCMVSLLLSGCGGQNSADGVTKITWYLGGVLEGGDYDLVMETVNQKLLEKYNMQLELICIDFGNYDQKMQVINAGREEYDLAFTSNWTNNFYRNISSGAYADITEKLPKLAPKLYASMDDYIWKAMQVDGKLYGVPNWQIQAKAAGYGMPPSKSDKAGVELGDISTLDDITEYLAKIQQFEPDSKSIGTMWSSIILHYGMLELVEESLPGAIYYAKNGKPVVVNQYETPEFENYIKTRRSWVENGLTYDTYTTNDTTASSEDVQRQPLVVCIYKPGLDGEVTTSSGYPWEFKQFSPAVLNTDGIISSVTAVSDTSKNVDQAIRFLEILHTDKELFNLLCWGIEGRQYTKVSENQISVRPNNGYSGISAWELGSVYNSYVLDNQPADLWEATKTYNEDALISPVLGFTPKTDNINIELANCKNVIKAQLELLELGLVPAEEGCNKLRSDLKAAGVEKIIAELQAQIDNWWGENR